MEGRRGEGGESEEGKSEEGEGEEGGVWRGFLTGSFWLFYRGSDPSPSEL